MKKEYMSPSMEMTKAETEDIMAGSDVIISVGDLFGTDD